MIPLDSARRLLSLGDGLCHCVCVSANSAQIVRVPRLMDPQHLLDSYFNKEAPFATVLGTGFSMSDGRLLL